MSPHDTVVYFYCKQSDDSRTQFFSIARSLIFQLTRNNSVCQEYMYTKILTIGASRTTSKKAYQEIIHTLVQCHNSLYLCIDGLDECEQVERNDILALISRLRQIQQPSCRLRLLVAACAEKDIEQSLQHSIHLELTRLHLNSDIMLYLKMMTTKVSSKFASGSAKSQGQFAAELFEKVVRRPEGKTAQLLWIYALLNWNQECFFWRR